MEIKESPTPMNQELIEIRHSPSLLHQEPMELQCASTSSMQDPAQIQTLSEEVHSKVTELQESPESLHLDPAEPSVLRQRPSPSQPDTPELQPSSPDASRADLSEHQESQASLHHGPAELPQSLTQCPPASADVALTASPASPVEEKQSSAYVTSNQARHDPVQLADTSCSARELNPEDELAAPVAPSGPRLVEPSSCSGESPPESPAQLQLGLSECPTETRPAGPSSPDISQDKVPLPPSPARDPEATLEQEDPAHTSPSSLQSAVTQDLSTLDQDLSSASSPSTHASQKSSASAPCSPSPALHRPTQHGGSLPASSPQPPEPSASDPLSPQRTAQTEVGQRSPPRGSTGPETLKDGSMQAVQDEQTLERNGVCPASANAVPPKVIPQSQDGDSHIVPVQASPVQSSCALSLDQSSSPSPTPESLVHRSPSEEHSSLPCSPGYRSPQNLWEVKPADDLQGVGWAGSTPKQAHQGTGPDSSHHREPAEPPTSSASLLHPEEVSEVEQTDQFPLENWLEPSSSRPSTPSDSLDQAIAVPAESNSSSSSVGPQERTGPTDRSSPHRCQTSPSNTQSGRSPSPPPPPASCSPQHWRPTETSAASACEGQRPSDVEILHSPPRSSHMTSSGPGSPAHVPRSPCDVCISPRHSPPQASETHCSPPHDSGPTCGPASSLEQGEVVASSIELDSGGPPVVDHLDSAPVEPTGDHPPLPATSSPDRPSTLEPCRAGASDWSTVGSAGGAAPGGPVHQSSTATLHDRDGPATSSPTQETSPSTQTLSPSTPQRAASPTMSPQSADEPANRSSAGAVTEPSPRPISPTQPAVGVETPQTPAAEEVQQQQMEELKVHQQEEEDESAAHSGESHFLHRSSISRLIVPDVFFPRSHGCRR